MFSIVLFAPEIPPNTGNIIRLCANTGSSLHLIKPMSFDMNHKLLKRAGLDYHEFAEVKVWDDWPSFIKKTSGRMFLLSTKVNRLYSDVSFEPNDIFIFGSETKGLPQEVFDGVDRQHHLTLPMHKQSRSLNLSNSVAIVVYEAWRQNQFQ